MITESEFEVIAKQAKATMRGIALQELGRDSADADDAVQNTLIWCWEKRNESINNYTKWLYASVRVISRHRKVDLIRGSHGKKWVFGPNEIPFSQDDEGEDIDPTTIYNAHYDDIDEKEVRQNALAVAIRFALTQKERYMIEHPEHFRRIRTATKQRIYTKLRNHLANQGITS